MSSLAHKQTEKNGDDETTVQTWINKIIHRRNIVKLEQCWNYVSRWNWIVQMTYDITTIILIGAVCIFNSKFVVCADSAYPWYLSQLFCCCRRIVNRWDLYVSIRWTCTHVSNFLSFLFYSFHFFQGGRPLWFKNELTVLSKYAFFSGNLTFSYLFNRRIKHRKKEETFC